MQYQFQRGTFINSAMVAGFIFLYAPILMIILFSFSASRIPGNWGGFSTQWYVALFQDRAILNAVAVSLRVAIASATIAVILGTIGAIVLVRFHNLRGKNFFHGLSTAPVLIPDIVLGLGLILLFVMLKNAIGWPQQLGIPTVTIAHATLAMAYVVIIVRSRLAEVDYHLEEAALDLGAKPHTVFFSITLPIISPALISGWLLAFTLSLDDVVLASFLTGPGTTTLALEVFSQIRYGLTPKINALASLMIVVIATGAVIAGYFSHRKSSPTRSLESAEQ